MRKLGMIGLGNVGALLANLLVARQIVDELVLIDTNSDLAVGLQNDLLDGMSALAVQPTIKVQDYAALKDADAVVLAIGNAELLKEQRFAELTDVGKMMRQIAPLIKQSGFSGVLLNLANPNEAATAYLQYLTELPRPKVIGLGTVLDTARLHRAIADQVHVAPSAVTGFVYGQHDGEAVPIWSTFRINGQPLEKPVMGQKIDPHQSEIQAKLNGWYAIKGQGQDVSGMALWTMRILQAVLSDEQVSFPVALYQPQYQSYLSFAAQLGRQGVGNYTLLPLRPLEEDQLKVAAQNIQDQLNVLLELPTED